MELLFVINYNDSGRIIFNFVFVLPQGLTPVEVGEGYERALEKTLEILPEIICHEIKDYRNTEAVSEAMKAALMSKQYGNERFLSKLITEACGTYPSVFPFF